MTNPDKNRRTIRMILLPVLAAGIIFLFVCAGRFLTYSDPLEPVDVIIPLSGNDESRIREAASLYHQKIGYNILLTKTALTYGEYSLPYTELQRQLLVDLGVPNGGIYSAEFVAKNTGQEATGIKERMYEYGFHSALIVTDAWHTRRVKMIFSDSFKRTGFRVLVHPVKDTGYNRNFWWLSGEGWKQTVGEYVRIIAYIIKRDTNIPDYPNFGK